MKNEYSSFIHPCYPCKNLHAHVVHHNLLCASKLINDRKVQKGKRPLLCRILRLRK